MRTPLLSLAFFAVLGTSPTASPQDWPRWRGANFDDASRETEIFEEPFELRVVWRRAVGSGYSAVSIADGLAVTQSSSDGVDWVVALDATSGEERWRHRISEAFPGLDGANDGPVSTPTLASGSVYALGPFGHLLALDLATGEERWSTHLAQEHGAEQPHWGFTTAPLVVGESVIVQTGGAEGHAITAFSTVDGEVQWHTGSDKIEYQSPILATVSGTEQVIACGERWLLGLEPSSGEELWKFDHQGSDFYRRIVNPLVIEDELLFLKNRRTESILVSLGTAEDGFPVDPVWTTRAIRSNYNMAVYNDGHVYGQNGGFLACIETFTGERVWRSRPPGNGWMILVDGHLVLLTKAGTLHVAPASPDGYDELAGMTLFERLVWTPPSFAQGRIYARDSFSEVACVEVVPLDEGGVASRAGEVPPGSFLSSLEQRFASSGDPSAAVDAFLAEQESYPVIDDEGFVHVFYRGEAEDLTLRGGMLPEGERPMTRLGHTDLHGASFELAADARSAYQFVRNYDEVLTDPLNPARTEALGFGVMSELVMPAHEVAELPDPDADLAGSLESFTVESPRIRVGGMLWGGGRRIDVYLPPGYAEGEQAYPVLYVNDGANTLSKLGLAALMDRAIDAGGRPAIVVFVQGVSAYEFARSQRHAYRKMIVEQVVPQVDERYRTIREPGARAIHGFSEGGYGALYAALSHPEVFGSVAAQSVYLGSMQGRDELLALVAEAEVLPRVYLDWGRYDTRDRVRDIDVVRFGEVFSAALTEAGCRPVGGEHPDGETFSCWQARLPAVLDSLAWASEGN